MIERVLENWLDKANERSFQVPFCHALAAAGHTVLHLSRHCAMELGKDIITIGPDGVPCAFQLKGAGGRRVSMGEWRSSGLEAQMMPLVTQKIVHPSIPEGKLHRAYIVLNGDLDEEVMQAISAFNGMMRDSGLPDRQVQTIVKGEMLRMFQALESDLWPPNLGDARTLLELYLDSGLGPVPQDKLCSLLCSALPLETKDGKPPAKTECSRSLAGAAIVCSLAISSFVERENHAAEFEAWTLFFSHILALAERWALPESYWKQEAELATSAMVSALGRLCDEMRQRSHLVQGNPFTDKGVLDVRTTHLLALMSLYGLWRLKAPSDFGQSPDADENTVELYLRDFCLDHSPKVFVWGEAAVTQALVYWLYIRNIDGTLYSTHILRGVLLHVLRANRPKAKEALPSPYYGVSQVLPRILGVDDRPIKDVFVGTSYTLEGLLHLYVRENFKQDVRSIWHEVTHFAFLGFTPEPRWKFFLWRSEEGYNETTIPPRTKHWNDLKREAEEDRGCSLPALTQCYPLHYLALLCVMPHRWTSDGVRWAASRLKR